MVRLVSPFRATLREDDVRRLTSRLLAIPIPAVPTKLFTHREFAFTLGESTYVRYNSFNNVEDFKKEIIRANPTRFEIGPIYNVRVSCARVVGQHSIQIVRRLIRSITFGQPRDRKSIPQHALRPELRELVFDIDMTDYDEIRTCCSGGAICRRCWGFIAAAVKVLDQSLRGEL
jgi:DNA primase small subunit